MLLIEGMIVMSSLNQGLATNSLLLVAAFIVSSATALAKGTLVVCPRGTDPATCDYVGDQGIQQAVDAADDGDIIRVQAGVYSPRSFRDVGFGALSIRGHIVVREKTLKLVAEQGAILDGSTGFESSAIIIERGSIELGGFVIRNYRAANKEDDLYDGHGIFVIDSEATIDDVSLENLEKMALSIRGHSDVHASNVTIKDGHVGIWIEEDARCHIERSVVKDNDSAGLAAYASSRCELDAVVFEGNLDDGIYAEGDASVSIRSSIIMRNRPYGVRSIENSQIRLYSGASYDNQEDLYFETSANLELNSGKFLFIDGSSR